MDKMVELTKSPAFYTGPIKFGKYKGKTLAEIVNEVDKNNKEVGKEYLSWTLKNMENLDEDMNYSINKVLGN